VFSFYGILLGMREMKVIGLYKKIKSNASKIAQGVTPGLL
jgi:hypothetical protein